MWGPSGVSSYICHRSMSWVVWGPFDIFTAGGNEFPRSKIPNYYTLLEYNKLIRCKLHIKFRLMRFVSIGC